MASCYCLPFTDECEQISKRLAVAVAETVLRQMCSCNETIHSGDLLATVGHEQHLYAHNVSSDCEWSAFRTQTFVSWQQLMATLAMDISLFFRQTGLLYRQNIEFVQYKRLRTSFKNCN